MYIHDEDTIELNSFKPASASVSASPLCLATVVVYIDTISKVCGYPFKLEVLYISATPVGDQCIKKIEHTAMQSPMTNIAVEWKSSVTFKVAAS